MQKQTTPAQHRRATSAQASAPSRTVPLLKKRPRGRPFTKGNTLRKDGVSGRAKGVRNKVTQSVATALKEAFDSLGGAEGLVEWAQSDPSNMSTFYQLAAKLIPQQITGAEFGPIDIVQRDALSDKILAAAVAFSGNGQDSASQFTELPSVTH